MNSLRLSGINLLQYRLGFIILIFSLSSCTRICTIDRQPIEISGTNREFPLSKIPCVKADAFSDAISRLAWAINSDAFATELTLFIRDSINNGPHGAAWQNLTPKIIIDSLKSQIALNEVTTYGGIVGLWQNVWFHTVAREGADDGPILINRIPLKKMDSSEIANTLAHEMSHRFGLSHPHSGSDSDVASKEPPYVIGEIIEKLAKNEFKGNL